MAYKYLNRSAVLEHLQEGQTVNIDEYIEKLRFFKKYTDNQGTYITDRRYIEAKKDPHALKNLPVGAVIRFTLHTGESIELLKHAAAHQFKRPFWFCQSSGRYMPVTRIPANYEVVTA